MDYSCANDWKQAELCPQIPAAFPPRVRPLRSISPERLQVRIGTRRSELLAAYQLVYRSYLARGYVAPHPSQIVYRIVHGLPSSRTVVAVNPAEQLLGTVTIVGDNALGIPMESAFSPEIALLRSEGRRVAEISALAIQIPRGNSSTEVLFGLIRFAVQYSCWRGFHDMLFSVHPRHRRFYERLFQASPLGSCRPHQSVRGNPALAYRVDLERIDRLPVYRQYFAEAIAAEQFLQPPMHPEDHRYFSLLSEQCPLVEFGSRVRQPRLAG